MKKLAVITLALLLALSLVACGNSNDPVDPVDPDPADVVDPVDPADPTDGDPVDPDPVDPVGSVAGSDVGKIYSTRWFEFSVDAFDSVTEYGGRSPASGHVFLVATVTETNTWSGNQALPMSDADFYMELNGDPDDFLYCVDAWDDTMMPGYFELEPGDSQTYNLVFEIPEDTQSVSFIYVEIAEDDSVGKTFTVNHTL